MWLMLIGAAMAGAPPSQDAGMIRTAAGVQGPDWGVWGDLGVVVVPHLSLRGGGELRFAAPASLYTVLELSPGPYWLHPLLAGGVSASLVDDRLVVAPRIELGARVLVRWGAGLRLVAVTDTEQLGVRLGGYLEW